MGLGPSKGDIKKILENSITNLNINQQKDIRIEYKFNYLNSENVPPKPSSDTSNINEGKFDEKDSFMFSQEVTQRLNSPKLNVKNTKIFPYSAIGTISTKFPVSDEIFENTCFLIDSNVVVTLASNLDNKNKGGKAISIATSFSNENAKWENIHIQDEDKSKKKSKAKDKNKSESLDNLSSKLAVIFYDNSICSEWLGVESLKKEDLDLKEIFAVFSFKEGKENTNSISEEEKEGSQFREIFVNNVNPFLDASKNGEEKDLELIKQSPGSPIFYRDFNNGAYAIAIINESFEFQYFDKKALIFLANMTNKGKLLLKKINKGIDEENIIQLDLRMHNFGPLDIKYLTEFNLKNLRILDLSSNPLKPQGALYLSEGTFTSLESLNLNLCEIGDEGLNHLSNGLFNKLNNLYLFHNNISAEGIKYLLKASYISNLVLLSLTENPNIGDTGVRYMKEFKGWDRLNMLNLSHTGITDISLEYLVQSSMPKLRKLNVQGNKFTSTGKASMDALRLNQVHISFRTQSEKQKLKEKKAAKENKK